VWRAGCTASVFAWDDKFIRGDARFAGVKACAPTHCQPPADALQEISAEPFFARTPNPLSSEFAPELTATNLQK
jgi:hypothetical protein